VARGEAALTQADVAERVGVATEVYGRMERGGLLPRLSTFTKLCRVLRTDANGMLGLSPSAPVQGLGTSRRPPEEPAPVRRLLRLVRVMNREQLAALTSVARVLVSPTPRAATDAPESTT
jgi:DNA-binding XRE family transcriptional regulator